MSNKIVLQLTDTYVLHFTLTDVDEYRTLRIESQWTGAKDPNGLQTRWQATLKYEEWVELTALLL